MVPPIYTTSGGAVVVGAGLAQAANAGSATSMIIKEVTNTHLILDISSPF
jgi:hypothetical protein